jgi:hypothetical protein
VADAEPRQHRDVAPASVVSRDRHVNHHEWVVQTWVAQIRFIK